MIQLYVPHIAGGIEDNMTGSGVELEEEDNSARSSIILDQGQEKLELKYSGCDVPTCDVNFILTADHQLKQIDLTDCIKPNDDVMKLLSESIPLIRWNNYTNIGHWEFWDDVTTQWNLYIEEGETKLNIIYQNSHKNNLPGHFGQIA